MEVCDSENQCECHPIPDLSSSCESQESTRHAKAVGHYASSSTASIVSEEDDFSCHRIGGQSPEKHTFFGENQRLKQDIQELHKTLAKRDAQVQELQERCQYLVGKLQEQDERIAQSLSVSEHPLRSSDLDIDSSSQSIAHNSNMKRYSGAGAAREMVDDRLDSMGFSGSRVESVVTSLAQSSRTKPQDIPKNVKDPGHRTRSSSSALERIGKAVDKIFYFSPSSSKHSCRARKKVEKDTSSSSTKSDKTSPDSRELRRQRSLHMMEMEPTRQQTHVSSRAATIGRSHSVTADHGYIPRPPRDMSRKLSASDFGLLAEPVDDEDSSDDESASSRVMKPPASDSSLQRTRTRSSSRSLRDLFAAIDDADKVPESGRQISRPKSYSLVLDAPQSSSSKTPEKLLYATFLSKLRRPECRDMLTSVQRFVNSVLGPRGDCRPPRPKDYVDYTFYGSHDFKGRYRNFFENLEVELRHHRAWKYASDAELIQARNGVEKYVMDKLCNVAMHHLPECAHWKQQDDALLYRMKVLAFVTPDMLDINLLMRNEVVWSLAEDELRRINAYWSPGDKLNCIVRCCSVIFGVLNLSRAASGKRPGADDFLPIFIYIVLRSLIPHLYSNCEYIATFRNKQDLMSKAGYCFVNLQSAIEFISVLDASMLSVSEDEFNRLYDESECKVRTGGT